jgi:hypothetical protein
VTDEQEQVIGMQESVTLLYSDIRGFTEMSTQMAPQELCTLLNSFYSAFDEHLDQRGTYKIDTIGDAFVVVGGLAIENSTSEHASAIADFALDMLAEIEVVKRMWKQIPGANPLIQGVNMRIGVHTGKVIAATVGLNARGLDLPRALEAEPIDVLLAWLSFELKLFDYEPHDHHRILTSSKHNSGDAQPRIRELARAPDLGCACARLLWLLHDSVDARTFSLRTAAIFCIGGSITIIFRCSSRSSC